MGEKWKEFNYESIFLSSHVCFIPSLTMKLLYIVKETGVKEPYPSVLCRSIAWISQHPLALFSFDKGRLEENLRITCNFM